MYLSVSKTTRGRSLTDVPQVVLKKENDISKQPLLPEQMLAMHVSAEPGWYQNFTFRQVEIFSFMLCVPSG